jgi:dTDP-4-dehydrorhamnose reductase
MVRLRFMPANYIVSASGFIGSELFRKSSKQFETIGTGRSASTSQVRFDLARPNEFQYDNLNPGDTIFLCAAVSSPDVCANDPEFATTVNVRGTSEFVRRAMERGSRIIFFSSDTVYGEQPNPFTEKQQPNPIGPYAEMKLQVEQEFMNDDLFKSIRISSVYDANDKFFSYLSHCAENCSEAQIFEGYDRAFVYLGDVVAGVLELAKRWDAFPYQTINFGGPHVMSRIEYVSLFRELVDKRLAYEVVTPDEDFFDKRPRRIAMKSELFEDLVPGGRTEVRTLLGFMSGSTQTNKGKTEIG